MRIAVLVSRFPSISETFVLSQITGLLDAGHEVDIFAWRSGGGRAVHPEIHRRRLLDRTRYLGPPEGYGARLASVPRLLWSAAERGELASSFRAIDVRKHGRFAASLGLLYAGEGFRGGAPYDILHCQFGELGRRAIALRDIGVARGKLVVSFRGADLTKNSRHGKYERVLGEADQILTVCASFRERLITEGGDPARVRVHRSGISICQFPYVPRTLSPGEPARLLATARLVEKKGVVHLLGAVAHLKRAGYQVHLNIIGDGPLRSRLEAEALRLQISSEVKFLGARGSDEVVRLLHSHHILVAPSVTASDGDQEGIPNSLKEAMATGMPVVSTWHSGIPELVEDGRSGFLVPERDEEALADRLAWLIDHPESWEGMGQEGRAKVSAEYDSRELNASLIAIYKGLVEE
jgi:colanic acid/amylovoran biosynthesis glycosyltransferase